MNRVYNEKKKNREDMNKSKSKPRSQSLVDKMNSYSSYLKSQKNNGNIGNAIDPFDMGVQVDKNNPNQNSYSGWLQHHKDTAYDRTPQVSADRGGYKTMEYRPSRDGDVRYKTMEYRPSRDGNVVYERLPQNANSQDTKVDSYEEYLMKKNTPTESAGNAPTTANGFLSGIPGATVNTVRNTEAEPGKNSEQKPTVANELLPGIVGGTVKTVGNGDSATEGDVVSGESGGNTEDKSEEENPTVKYYDEWEKEATDAAAADRAAAEAAADETHQRSVVDANNAYEQNKSTYGANAETMKNMGLTGSGYSEYLNASAYAQQRDDVQEANAQRTKSYEEAARIEAEAKLEISNIANKGRLEAEKEYTEKIEREEREEEDNKKETSAYFQDFYNNLLSGTYTYSDEIIDGFKDTYGFSDYEIETLKDAAKKGAANKNAIEAYNRGDVIGYYKYSVTAGNISAADAQNGIYNYFASCFDAEGANINDIANKIDELEVGVDITIDQKQNLKNKYNAKIDTSANHFKNDDGTFIDPSTASQKLNQTINHSWVDGTVKNRLTENYKKIYIPITRGLTFSRDTWETDLSKEGNDFWIKIGDTEYKVESRGVEADTYINQIAGTVGDNVVFALRYKGDSILYMKRSGIVYKIGAAGNNGGFNSAKNYFF